MGVSTSSEVVETFQDSFLRQVRTITQLAGFSYEDLEKCIAELNTLTKYCEDANGKKLIFATKKGTDSTILWKGTIKIACVKYDPTNKKIDVHRYLTLNEFLKVFKTIQCQMKTKEASQTSTSRSTTANSILECIETGFADLAKPGDSNNECCICLERKPETSLPCTHCFCLICIEQWSVNNKTCPICREELSSTDDTWVISEAPFKEEIINAIYSSLMEMADEIV